MSTDLALVRVPPGPERDACLPLLLLADESRVEVDAYYQRGRLYALVDADALVEAAGGAPLGVVLVLPTDAGAELKSVAVDPDQHNRGLGQRMLALVLDALRADGVRRVAVGTSNAGVGQLAFYQKAGFRLFSVERDYFTPEKGYGDDAVENGIRHRDMVWLDQEL